MREWKEIQEKEEEIRENKRMRGTRKRRRRRKTKRSVIEMRIRYRTERKGKDARGYGAEEN